MVLWFYIWSVLRSIRAEVASLCACALRPACSSYLSQASYFIPSHPMEARKCSTGWPPADHLCMQLIATTRADWSKSAPPHLQNPLISVFRTCASRETGRFLAPGVDTFSRRHPRKGRRSRNACPWDANPGKLTVSLESRCFAPFGGHARRAECRCGRQEISPVS